KGGARFHFDLPGAVQGFRTEESAETRGVATLRNVAGHSARGARSLAMRFRALAPGRSARAVTATFIPPEAKDLPGYGLMASPTLYPGQKVRAGLLADSGNNRAVTYRLYLQTYDANDSLRRLYGPEAELAPGVTHELAWRVPDTEGYPIAEIGIELTAIARADGAVYLDYLTWDGAPEVALRRTDGGTMWRRAWVNGVDMFESWAEPYRLIQNEGIGLLIHGAREWTDYRVSATITPHLARSAGIAARVQGMRRYVALLLCNDDTARLVRVLDGHSVLAETAFSWDLDTAYALSLQVKGSALQGWIDGKLFFDLPDADQPLTGGAVALVCEEGRIAADTVRIQPTG
ncbi:MAG TPA: hypothetical protein VKT32_12405, partial [Chthonomonadaceae bacterium]|nr:hypothetical protein [Chthonomonadaceae bacterium]